MQKLRKEATRIVLGEDWQAPETEGFCQRAESFVATATQPGEEFLGSRQRAGGRPGCFRFLRSLKSLAFTQSDGKTLEA